MNESKKGFTIIESPIDTLEANLFNNDKALKEVTLPNTLKHIKSTAFSTCISLSSIYFNGTKEEWKEIEFEDRWDSSLQSYTIYCLDGELTKIK